MGHPHKHHGERQPRPRMCCGRHGPYSLPLSRINFYPFRPDRSRQRGLYEKAALGGGNLYTHLSDIYRNQARYCILLLSKHYATKVWTKHEREAAQARAFNENRPYILPVRLDETEIPGVLPTIGYLGWPPENEESIADAVVTKLGKPPRQDSSSGQSVSRSAQEVDTRRYCSICGAVPGNPSKCRSEPRTTS